MLRKLRLKQKYVFFIKKAYSIDAQICKHTNKEGLENNSCCMKRSKNFLWKKLYENLWITVSNSRKINNWTNNLLWVNFLKLSAEEPI